MKRQLNIAIFSGAIPSSTFIEHLIEGIAKEHSVFLFGVIESPKTYRSKVIKFIIIIYKKSINLLLF